jgi:hypothetical protein
MSSPTTLRVVITDVGRGLCPILYPKKSTPCAQSRVPGSDSLVDGFTGSLKPSRKVLPAGDHAPRNVKTSII